MRARLGRYALWQLRDYVFERGFPSLIVSGFMLLQVVILARARGAALDRDTALMMLLGVFGFICFIASLLSVNGIVSTDRTRGYYRFLFAKPVSLTRYYLQAFALNGVGLLLVIAAFFAAFSMFVYPLAPPGAFALAALYYVCAGGVGFLLSAAVRFDWLSLAGIWLGAEVARAVVPPSSGLVGQALNVLLPPTHLFSRIAPSLVTSGDARPASLVWIAGYGVAAVLLGLVVLRRRSLAA